MSACLLGFVNNHYESQSKRRMNGRVNLLATVCVCSLS